MPISAAVAQVMQQMEQETKEYKIKLKYTMPILQTEDLQAEIILRLENKGYICCDFLRGVEIFKERLLTLH